ncbi:hypothetical protein BX600DRAFT_519485 [Xylariales sp. PMI_506]|nr:hypothetical protein BX600DRAFT_519485 [Xylariales sp. PMI_506]
MSQEPHRAPLEVLYLPNDGNGQIDVDIVAVHGLGANVDWSWVYKDGAKHVHWLKDPDMLPAVVPNARIMVYNYASRWDTNAPKIRLSICGEELMSSLQNFRGEASQPIIFIGHSLGGNVIIHALLHADTEAKYKNILTSTTGLVFLGTPFRGTKMKPLADVLAKLMRPVGSHDGVLKGLGYDDPDLRDSLHNFCRLGNKLNIDVSCFYELFETDYGKRFHAGGLLKGMVVEEASACIPGFERYPTQTDHFKLNKYPGPNDRSFLSVASVIKRMYISSSKIMHQQQNFKLPLHLRRETNQRHCYIPLRQNHKFTGRDTILKKLQEKLFLQQDCQKLAVVGLGGVGKTQIALQFAYWVKESQPDYSILWVSASSHASFEQTYQKIIKRLVIPADDKDQDPGELVRQYLESEDGGKWFLIVDNADDMEVLYGSSDSGSGIFEYLPESENCLLLFTTRAQDVGVAVAETDLIELEAMTPEEAQKLMEKSLLRKGLLQDEEIAKELLQELTHLPLAIAQAAAYLNRKRHVTIQGYLKLLRGTEDDMVSLLSREFRDNTLFQKSQQAVATTWLVSFDQIQRSDKDAADLLSFVSCIEAKAIPRSLLPPMQTAEETEHAIGTLCGYAFLVSREDGEVFDMHRLVHTATRVWTKKYGSSEQTMRKAICHLAEVFPSELWREYLPHALGVIDGSNKYESGDLASLSMDVGSYLFDDRRFKEAIRCFQKALRWRAANFCRENASRLATEHALASAYLDDRRIKEAITMFEHVVEIRKDTLVETDHSRLNSEHSLASAYLNDRRIKEAIKMFEHIVEIQKDTLVETDHSRLISEHALASAYLNDRRIKEAITMLEHVVEIQKDTLVETDHSRLTTEHSLASAYLNDRRIKEAIKMFEHIVEIQKDTLVETDHSRLISKHELASAYLDDRRIKEAITMFEHVVEIQKDTLVETDHSRLATEHALASAYLDDRRIKEAITMFEYIVEIQKDTLVETDHSRLVTEHELARAYLDDRRIKEAITMFEHIVEIEKDTLVETDHSRLATEHELARAYLDDNQTQKAINLLEHVVEIESQLYDEHDPDRRASVDLLTDAYNQLEAEWETANSESDGSNQK